MKQFEIKEKQTTTDAVFLVRLALIFAHLRLGSFGEDRRVFRVTKLNHTNKLI